MELHLHNKRVLVSGGTRGIGLNIVMRFLELDAKVAFCARSVEAVEKTERKLAATGATVRGWPVDIAQSNAVTSWVEQAAEFLSGIDIVIANASGMAIGDDDSSWQHNWAVDIGGLRYLLSAARHHLEQSAKTCGDAAVIAVASSSASKGLRVESYGPVKAALVHYIKGLSRELAIHHIRANTISPGPTYVEDGFWGNAKKHKPELFKYIVDQFPMGDLVQPEDIANIVTFLASKYARAIVGCNIIADGGRSDHIQL